MTRSLFLLIITLALHLIGMVPIVLGVEDTLTLTRAPYLQQLSSRSTILIWHTSVPSLGSINWGKDSVDENGILSDSKPVKVHQVLLENLEPYTIYKYRITNALPMEEEPLKITPDEITSEVYSFQTAPEDGNAPVRIAVFGDAGAGTEEQRKIRDILDIMSPQILLVTGDLVYSSGTDKNYQEKFFDVYKNLFTSCCVYPSPGNHDYGFTDGESYFSQFILPANNPDQDESYYSFDFGAGHFISLDTTRILDSGDRGVNPQVEWLENDLASTTKTWKIVYFHHPPYTTALHGSDLQKPEIRQTLTPLFEQYGVDLVFSGHDHVYERFQPILQNKVVDAWQGSNFVSPLGPIYYVSGGGGRGLYPRVDSEKDIIYSAFFRSIHHALDITMTEDEVSVGARTMNGSLMDAITITKKSPRPSFLFRRGDSNRDGLYNMSDAINVLNFLFLGKDLNCHATSDWNSTNEIEISDASGGLEFLFRGGRPAAPPFPDCEPLAENLEAWCFKNVCRP